MCFFFVHTLKVKGPQCLVLYRRKSIPDIIHYDQNVRNNYILCSVKMINHLIALIMHILINLIFVIIDEVNNGFS